MQLSRREFVGAVPSVALLAGLKSVEPAADDPLGVRKDFPVLSDETKRVPPPRAVLRDPPNGEASLRPLAGCSGAMA